ncbi:MAG: hypothetical protein GY868_19160 [Deltaproteobacteria bacterium]|nr:hypothetical protein [Deltaproteobacteria bacterium]
MTEAVNKPGAEAAEQREAYDDLLTMSWAGDARALLPVMPPAIVASVVKNSEAFAQQHGYEQVTRQSIAEQMTAMGMDLDAMLTSCPYALKPRT